MNKYFPVEELDVAMAKITLDIFNNLDYGCQINLTEKYALYKYSEDDMIVVVEISDWDELFVVQTDGENIVFTEL